MSNRPGRKIARHQTHHTRSSGAERHDRQGRMIAVGLAAIVAIGVTVAIVAALTTSDGDGGPTALNGVALPAFTGEGFDEAVGLKAPIFRTEDFEGNSVVTGGGGGPNDTAKIIGFFAHWCPGCMAELPRVVDWLDRNELPERVEMIAVSTRVDSSRDNYPPEDWFAAERWPWPVRTDNSSSDIATGYGLVSTPYWVVLDDHNVVLARTAGGLGDQGIEELVDLAAASIV